MNCYTQCPQPCIRPQLTHVSAEDSWTLTGKSGSVSCGDNRGWDGWMASLTQWTCLSNLRELVMDREAWHATVHEVAKSWTWLSDWIELCLIFSPDCPPTTDGNVYNEAKEALLNFTMYFILLISISKLIICTLNELKYLTTHIHYHHPYILFSILLKCKRHSPDSTFPPHFPVSFH